MATTPKQQPESPMKRAGRRVAARRAQPVPRSWDAFQLRLAEALSTLEDEQYLLLCHKTSPHFVQFASFGHGGLRAEAVSNTSLKEGEKLDDGQLQRLQELGWLGPTVPLAEAAAAGHRDGGGTPNHFRDWPHPAPFAEVAALAVTTLRDVLGVQAPSRLCYRARNRRRERILLPALRINPLQETPEPTKERTAAVLWPRSWEELQQAVIAVLREYTTNPELEADADGEIPIRYGGAIIWVWVDRQSPAIEVFSRVLTNVEPTPDLLAALNDLNLTHRPTTFFVVNSRVVAAIEVDGNPFHPPALLRTMDYLGHLVDQVDDDLSARFGGRTALDNNQPARPGSSCQKPN